MTVRRAYNKGAGGPVVAKENAFSSLCTNVSVWVVLRALGRISVQDRFAKSDDLLRERASSGSFPGGDAVLASHECVDEEACVLEQSLHHWMGYRDVPVYALFETHFDCSQGASENANADFDASVGL